MARINIEEEWWTDPRRDLFILACNKNEEEADGCALKFWLLAQEFWRHRRLVPAPKFMRLRYAQEFISAGLAEIKKEFVYVRGTKEKHEWLAKYSDNGKKGGLAKAKRYRLKLLVNSPSEANSVAIASSSSSSSSSSSNTKKEEKFQLTKENLDQAYKAWLETLAKMKMGRANLIALEQRTIAEAIQRHGVLAVVSALRGAGNAPKDDFDSSWFSDVTRVLNPKNFLRFVNLGIQQLHKEHNASSDS